MSKLYLLDWGPAIQFYGLEAEIGGMDCKTVLTLVHLYMVGIIIYGIEKCYGQWSF